MTLDNSEIIAGFIQSEADSGYDPDRFLYTEMLDRTAKKGNNNHRLVKSFFHRSREDFWRQWPTIKELCDMTKTRAYTRLAPRSYRKVGKEFLVLVAEAAAQENWDHMKALYNSACGRSSPTQKLWLFDVDAITENTDRFKKLLTDAGYVRGVVPSKKGEHIITVPFDPRPFVGSRIDSGWNAWGEISLHKDNPTNLYIPEGAA